MNPRKVAYYLIYTFICSLGFFVLLEGLVKFQSNVNNMPILIGTLIFAGLFISLSQKVQMVTRED